VVVELLLFIITPMRVKEVMSIPPHRGKRGLETKKNTPMMNPSRNQIEVSSDVEPGLYYKLKEAFLGITFQNGAVLRVASLFIYFQLLQKLRSTKDLSHAAITWGTNETWRLL
jgi:hypothetical protein